MAERRRRPYRQGGADLGGATRRLVALIEGRRPLFLRAANDNRAPLRLQLLRAAMLLIVALAAAAVLLR